MAPPAFLCYRQAYRAKKAGEITEEEYFQHVFQHMIWEHDCTAMAKNDSLGFVIRDVCYSNEHLINDTMPFQDIFLAFSKGLQGDFEAKLEKVPEDYREEIRKGLAWYALRKGDAETLEWILERCWGQMGSSFEELAYTIKKARSHDEASTKLWKVVQNSHFIEPPDWKGRKSMYAPDGYDLR